MSLPTANVSEITFTDALSPTLFAAKIPHLPQPLPAPWGTPSTGRRPPYPPSFPPGLRTLISLIPLQPPSIPIGQNIRPVAIAVTSTFTPAALRDISMLVEWAPVRVREDMARIVAGVIRYCWIHGCGQRGGAAVEFLLGRVGWMIRWYDMVEKDIGCRFWRWVYRLMFSDVRLIGLPWSRPYTSQLLQHLLLRHVLVRARPSDDVPVSVTMTACTCPEFAAVREMNTGRFVASLASVPVEAGDENESCGVCLERFGEGDEPEDMVRLSCGHGIGRMCLGRWLKEDGRRHCPMCRGDIELPDAGRELTFQEFYGTEARCSL